MYAFGIGLAIEGIQPRVSTVMSDNFNATALAMREGIHYCYGDAVWNKRQFRERSPLSLRREELPDAGPGTVLAEIVRQIRSAQKAFCVSYDER
jgi:hypothetical protein